MDRISKKTFQKFTEEYESILAQLAEATEADRKGLFQDLVRLIRRILDYQLRKESSLKERMDGIDLYEQCKI